MKTVWTFYFKTHGFVFENDYKFKGNVLIKAKRQVDKKIEFDLFIEPEKEKERNIYFDQAGKISITIPFDKDESKKYIDLIIFQVSQKISYDFGNMEIDGGLVTGEQIPETEEEKEMLGDNTCFAEANIEILDKLTVSNPKIMNHNKKNIELMSQYNHATKLKSIIEKYTALFKVLENIYSKNVPRERIRSTLNNDDLFEMYREAFIESETVDRRKYIEFVDKIVDIRHKCSHLKNQHQFGYLPYDKELETEVKPIIEKLQHLIKYVIDNYEK